MIIRLIHDDKDETLSFRDDNEIESPPWSDGRRGRRDPVPVARTRPYVRHSVYIRQAAVVKHVVAGDSDPVFRQTLLTDSAHVRIHIYIFI